MFRNIKTTPSELFGTELGYYLDMLYIKQFKDEPLPASEEIYDKVLEYLTVDIQNKIGVGLKRNKVRVKENTSSPL